MFEELLTDRRLMGNDTAPVLSMERMLELLNKNPAIQDAVQADAATLLAKRREHVAAIDAQQKEVSRSSLKLLADYIKAQAETVAAKAAYNKAKAAEATAQCELAGLGLRSEAAVHVSRQILEATAHPAIARFIDAMRDLLSRVRSIQPSYIPQGSSRNPVSLYRENHVETNVAALRAAADRVRQAQAEAESMLHDDNHDVIKRLSAIRDDVAKALRVING